MEVRREDGQKPTKMMAQQQQEQQQQEQSLPRVATLSEIEKGISLERFVTCLVDATLKEIVSFSHNNFNVPPIQTMGGPPGKNFAQICVKSGHLMLSFFRIIIKDDSSHTCSQFIKEIHTSSLEHIVSFECITELFMMLCSIILFKSFLQCSAGYQLQF